MKQKVKELNGEMDHSTIMVGHYNNLLSIYEMVFYNDRKSTNTDLSNITNQCEVTIYRIFYPTIAHMEHFLG